jgi:hypothetical protein
MGEHKRIFGLSLNFLKFGIEYENKNSRQFLIVGKFLTK